LKYHKKAWIHKQISTGEDIFLLVLECPEIVREARPGQFVNLRTAPGLEPLLRRPISIFLAEPATGLLYLWYQVVGRGTASLSKLKEGDYLDLIGPLGNGFALGAGQRIALVGGGMGIAPLVFLAREAVAYNQVTAFFGTRTAGQMPPAEYLPAMETILVTEDGSTGRQGLVTDSLKAWLEKEKPDLICACGPKRMLAQVQKTAMEHRIPLQVSLETVMACGLGACLGCTCKQAVAENGAWLKVCQDGPVFRAEEVQWDD